MSKIIVTGGAGFIGSHIVDRLIELGHQVVVVDNLSTGQVFNLNKWASFYEMSVEDSKLEDVFIAERPEYVFHLASNVSVNFSFKDVVYDANTNIIGSLNLLKNCQKFGVKKIIFSSSAAVYGQHDQIPVKEDYLTKPTSPYGISKMTVESYLDLFASEYNLESVVLRYSNVYGPRQTTEGETGVISIFIDNLIKGQQPRIAGDGLQTRDFVYVSDVVEANLAAMKEEVSGGVYNISSNTETSVKDLFYLLKEMVGSNCSPVYIKNMPTGVSRSCLSNDKARQELGWEPKYSLFQGLKETLGYYRRLSSDEDVWLIMPAYNEGKRLARVLKALSGLAYNVVVVDDSSNDDTVDIAQRYNCHLVRHPINYGQGASLQAGMEYALQHGAKVLVHFDSDGQMQVKDIEAMIRPILNGEVDVTFGSRFLTGKDNVPKIKKWCIHKPAIYLNWLLTGLKMSDAHCGFRAFSAEAARKLEIKQNRMAHATEILELVNYYNLRYKEVPVDILYLEYGQNFLKGFKILRDLFLGKLFR